jgi:hypothetical protein
MGFYEFQLHCYFSFTSVSLFLDIAQENSKLGLVINHSKLSADFISGLDCYTSDKKLINQIN